MIYFTSDLHFQHKNILKFSPNSRPYKDVDEMDKHILEVWNNTVTDEDDVYVLGDVLLGNKNRALGTLGQLNGILHLVVGNHDIVKHLIPYFLTIQDYKELKLDGKTLIMSHYPFASWNKKKYGSIHLHGHTHGSLPSILLKESNNLPIIMPSNRYDVGWDVYMKPVTLEEILDGS